MAVNRYGDLSAYGWGRALLEDEGAGFGDEVSEDALPRYIDPLNDWGFKRLFRDGDEQGVPCGVSDDDLPGQEDKGHHISADRAARDGRRGQERKIRRDVQG